MFVCALAGVASLLALACGPGAAQARVTAQPARAPSHAHTRAQPRPPIQLVLDSVTPTAPGPRSTVRITGRLVNNTDTPLTGVQVRLRYSTTPLHYRDQLAFYADGTGQVPDPAGATPPAPGVLDVAARSSGRWRIEVDAAALGLRQFGVYPIAVEALNAYGGRLDLLRTFLPYVPDTGRPQPTLVAWLWPLIDRPHRADDTTWLDDALNGELAPGGRLDALVSAAREAKDVPLTWVVDPALLDDAQAMKNPYRIRSHPSPAPASAAARRWLTELREAVGTSPVVVTPYADPDVVALTRAGLDADIDVAMKRGAQIAAALLGRQPQTQIAWPPDGLADNDTMDVLKFSGTDTVVLSDQALQAQTALTYTPNAVASVPTSDGPTRVLLADSVVSSVLGQDTRSAGSTALEQQRFLAETALITAERPNQSRSLLIAPPRRWNPDPRFAKEVLADTAQVPWLKPVPLDRLKTAAKIQRRLTYPRSAHDAELGPDYLKDVMHVRSAIKGLDSIFDPPGSSEFDLAIPRMESSAWRDDPVRGRRFRTAISSAVHDATGKVRILTSSSVTLGGTRGTIPITVANNFPADTHQTVTVYVEVTSLNSARLIIGPYTKQIQVGPQRKETINVPLTTHAAGIAIAELSLRTPDDRPLSDPVRLTVYSGGLGNVATWITGIAIAVIFLAIGARAFRRGRGGDDAEPGPGPETGPGDRTEDGRPAAGEPEPDEPATEDPAAARRSARPDRPEERHDPARPTAPPWPVPGRPGEENTERTEAVDEHVDADR